MGLLADIYSGSDSLKRKVKGLLADPLGTIEQKINQFGEDQQTAINNAQDATGFGGNRSVLMSQQQKQQARQAMGDYASSMGLAGTVASKFSYPQDKALATAQKNAALPVAKGGLGLRPDNTPLERAQAMGFTVEGTHTSRHGIDTNVLDSGKYAMAPFDSIGTHFGTKEAALDRFNRTVGTTEQFKGSTYPVFLDGSRPMMNKSGGIFNEDPLMMQLSEKADYGNLPVSNAAQRKEMFSNASIIPYINDVEGPGSISYIAPPENIRSRFAAFDPARRNESDILGKVDNTLLQVMAGAGLLGAGGYAAFNDK